MNRTTLSLIGAGTALAAVTGIAALAGPAEESAGGSPAAERLPVQRSMLVCPQPTESTLAETQYTAFTPKGATASGDGKGSAELLPAERADEPGDDGSSGDGKKDEKDDEKDEKGDKEGKDGKKGGGEQQPDPVLPLKEPGKPVTATTDRSDAPALIGTADGRFAPGWSVQQTTRVDVGLGRGLLGTSCSTPDTEFWFPGASTAEERRDYVHLTNPDATGAVVDLELYGKDGAIESATGEGITVPPRSTVPVLLSTLTEEPVTNVAVRATVRNGRVAAQVQAADEELGSDWLPPAAVPASRVVLPGIPGDATEVRLVVFAPGERDADLKLRMAGKSGQITPAGNETLHVKAGMTAAVDLGDVTKGEAGSLILSPSEGAEETPVVAAVRVVRGKGSKQESAFIPSTAEIEERATAADNRSKGATLSMVAPGKSAKVKVTASAGSEGGSPQSKTYTVEAGRTLSVTPPLPKGGKGTYAVTVERLSGGPVHASRMLETERDGVPMFTLQPLPDDGGTVEVPKTDEDLSVLTE